MSTTCDTDKNDNRISKVEYVRNLDNDYGYKQLFEHFGLDSYDSYYSIVVGERNFRIVSEYIYERHSSKHLEDKGDDRSYIVKRNLNGVQYLDNAPIENSIDIDIKLVPQEHCFKVEYDGSDIIVVRMMTHSQNDYQYRNIMLSKQSIDHIKRFLVVALKSVSTTYRESLLKEKRIMVYTNVRKGGPTGSYIQTMQMYDPMGVDFSAMSSDWKPSQAVRARSFKSIYLNSELKQKLLADIEEFMSIKTQEWYEFHDIPSKRSYLFYGPPGTGKTSTIKAIASQYNMDLYIMKLNLQNMDDQTIINLVEQIKPRSILLIEDIDAAFNNFNNPNNTYQQLSFSGLMNILDGVTSFVSQIIILTTNNRDSINRESLRVGRIDYELEFGYMDVNQVFTMLESFYPDSNKDLITRVAENVGTGTKTTPAELQEVIIRCKNKEFEYLVDNFDSIIDDVRAGRQAGGKKQTDTYIM